jgi:hypothetical protein
MWLTIILEFVGKFIAQKHKSVLAWTFVFCLLGFSGSVAMSEYQSKEYTDSQVSPIVKVKSTDSLTLQTIIENQRSQTHEIHNLNNRVDDIYKLLIETPTRRNHHGNN